MSDSMNEWDDLQSEWQSYEPDIKKIKKKIDWVTWRMYFVLAIDVIALITFFPAMYFITQDNESNWLFNSFHYIVGVLFIYGVYLDFKIRLPILRSQDESMTQILSLYLKRTKAGVIIGRWGKYFSWVLIALFVIWFAANYFFQIDKADKFTWRFGLFGIVWISIWVVVSHWYEQKKQREYEKLKSLWKDFIEE